MKWFIAIYDWYYFFINVDSHLAIGESSITQEEIKQQVRKSQCDKIKNKVLADMLIKVS